jgi:hypothetical protein
MAASEAPVRRRLFNHARSYEVDPGAGRFVVRPLRAWYLAAALGCASMAAGPWLVTRLGPYELSLGGWTMVLAYAATALALAAVGLSPRNRRLELDLPAAELRVGAPFGLGPGRRYRTLELRFGFRERLLPIGDIVACRATVSHPGFGELIIVETDRDHKRLPKRSAHALERARRTGENRHLEPVAEEIAGARGLGWRGLALVVALLAGGPAWWWWHLA